MKINENVQNATILYSLSIITTTSSVPADIHLLMVVVTIWDVILI